MLWEAEDRNIEVYGMELDVILDKIYRLDGKQSIIFSSFSLEICDSMSTKQQDYPILFINKVDSVPAGDVRASSLQQAIQFAKSWNLARIVMLSDTFVMCPRLVQYARSSGLVCGSYGNLNDDPETAMVILWDSSIAFKNVVLVSFFWANSCRAYIQANAGLDAIIVNRVRLISETLAEANSWVSLVCRASLSQIFSREV